MAATVRPPDRSSSSLLAVAVPARMGGGSLDLHEGISDPGPPERFSDLRQGCPRWPELLRLRWQRGELTGLVQGRCGATNLCRYCQRLYVIETVEMLQLDALENAPELWLVLTAREHLTRRDTYRHLEQLRRAARRRWPSIEWFVQVEFQRRGALHLNLLVKGVEAHDLDALHALMVNVWCSRVDALPAGQWSGTVAEARGVIRYLTKMLAHGLKAEQAPPIGWRGHRTSQTRGYLVRPASVMREEAKASLRLKRELWRVERQAIEQGLFLDAETVWEIAEQLVACAGERTWKITTVPAPRPDWSKRERVAGEISPWLRDVVELGAGTSNPPRIGLPLSILRASVAP